MCAVQSLLDRFHEGAVLRIVDNHAAPRNRLQAEPMTSNRATKCKRDNRSAKSPHNGCEAMSSAVFMSMTKRREKGVWSSLYTNCESTRTPCKAPTVAPMSVNDKQHSVIGRDHGTTAPAPAVFMKFLSDNFAMAHYCLLTYNSRR